MTFVRTLLTTAAAVVISTGAMAAGDYNSSSANRPSDEVSATNSESMDATASSNTTANTSVSVSGMDSGTIQSVQSSLKSEGHSVSVDGKWGPQTASALREFQMNNDLPATGQLDTQTLAALNIDMNQ
ncbi:MAG: hypothetical protein DI626_10310 [Micavibrio aeruginosavorus]|uniref:Peptidoglycan binding-like domain-containing protein n=1 Tax=Micavibrio aeruginosavorus TaxID=349221 RepID=A0A2W5BGG0_9BACT|nr:MAG: hypothetical protein DI626_10310 [Micavibrio aeruginosavorus]